MGVTAGHGLRYPELRGEPPDLATEVHNLADDVEAALAALIPDSGVVTTLAVTANTGWSFTSSEYRTIGPKMWLLLNFSRTGADVVADAAGNITDAPVGTITDVARRPAVTWYGLFKAAVTSGSAQIGTDGGILLTDAHSGATISTGNGVNIYAKYSIP